MGDGLMSGVPVIDDSEDNFIVQQFATFLRQVVVKGKSFFENNATFLADVIFKGRVTFSSDTAGRAIVPKWSKSVDVVFERAYESPPSVTVSLVLTDKDDSAFLAEGANAAVATITETGFTIVLDQPAPRDFEYQWVALAVDNPKKTVGTSIFGDTDITIPTPAPTPAPALDLEEGDETSASGDLEGDDEASSSAETTVSPSPVPTPTPEDDSGGEVIDKDEVDDLVGGALIIIN